MRNPYLHIYKSFNKILHEFRTLFRRLEMLGLLMFFFEIFPRHFGEFLILYAWSVVLWSDSFGLFFDALILSRIRCFFFHVLLILEAQRFFFRVWLIVGLNILLLKLELVIGLLIGSFYYVWIRLLARDGRLLILFVFVKYLVIEL